MLEGGDWKGCCVLRVRGGRIGLEVGGVAFCLSWVGGMSGRVQVNLEGDLMCCDVARSQSQEVHARTVMVNSIVGGVVSEGGSWVPMFEIAGRNVLASRGVHEST